MATHLNPHHLPGWLIMAALLVLAALWVWAILPTPDRLFDKWEDER